MTDIICRSCGRKVPKKANFCRFCGTKIDSQPKKTTSSLYTKPVLSSNKVSQTQNQKIPEKKGVKEIPPLDEAEIKVIYGNKRLETIKNEKNSLLAEMEELEQKFKIGVISSAEFEKKLGDLDEKIEGLREEEKNLRTGSIPVEDMIAKYKESLEKLKKIEDMKESNKITSENVYEKLKREYSQKKKELEQELRFEKNKIEKWMKTLKNQIETIDDDREALTAKLSLGDMTEEEVTEKRNKYEHKKRVYSIALKEYKTILDNFPL